MAASMTERFDLSCRDGLKAFNTFMEDKSYVNGFTLQKDDFDLFEYQDNRKLFLEGAPDVVKYNHASRWYRHINSFSIKEQVELGLAPSPLLAQFTECSVFIDQLGDAYAWILDSLRLDAAKAIVAPAPDSSPILLMSEGIAGDLTLLQSHVKGILNRQGFVLEIRGGLAKNVSLGFLHDLDIVVRQVEPSPEETGRELLAAFCNGHPKLKNSASRSQGVVRVLDSQLKDAKKGKRDKLVDARCFSKTIGGDAFIDLVPVRLNAIKEEVWMGNGWSESKWSEEKKGADSRTEDSVRIVVWLKLCSRLCFQSKLSSYEIEGAVRSDVPPLSQLQFDDCVASSLDRLSLPFVDPLSVTPTRELYEDATSDLVGYHKSHGMQMRLYQNVNLFYRWDAVLTFALYNGLSRVEKILDLHERKSSSEPLVTYERS